MEYSSKTLYKSSPSDHTHQRQVFNHQNNNCSSDELDFSAEEDDATLVRFQNLKDIYSSCSFSLMTVDPTIYEEAQKDEIWIKVMNEEIEAIQRNGTWELTSLPEKMKVVGLKWIFKSEFNSDGTLLKKKARLVAKGFLQLEGIDLDEVFSPVTRMETMRLFLALSTQKEWKIHQLDVKLVFLNGDLKEEVFVTQPERFIVDGREDHVYCIHKALYGLRQAPRAWYS